MSCFAKNSDLLTDDDLIELMAECNQSLASDDESSSSSDSSRDKPFKKIKHQGGGLLMPTPAQLDPLNPYNQAWTSHHHFQQATMQRFDPGMPYNKALFPVMQAHQQQTFPKIPHYHTGFVNYNMIPVQQTPFNVPFKPVPSPIESLGSP